MGHEWVFMKWLRIAYSEWDRLRIKIWNIRDGCLLGQAVKIKLEHDKLSGEATVQEAVTEVAAVMGENVRLRRGFLVSSPTGIISSYLHASAQPGVHFNQLCEKSCHWLCYLCWWQQAALGQGLGFLGIFQKLFESGTLPNNHFLCKNLGFSTHFEGS